MKRTKKIKPCECYFGSLAIFFPFNFSAIYNLTSEFDLSCSLGFTQRLSFTAAYYKDIKLI